jgi:hypothetical protein
MNQITKASLLAAFKALDGELGGRVAKSYDDHGAYTLDGAYGGYRIEQICTDSTGVSAPFGHRRMSKAEAYHTFWFAVEVLRQAKTTGEVA